MACAKLDNDRVEGKNAEQSIHTYVYDVCVYIQEMPPKRVFNISMRYYI